MLGQALQINNFIDFIFDMKISVPKQWQMKKVKLKLSKKERKIIWPCTASTLLVW